MVEQEKGNKGMKNNIQALLNKIDKAVESGDVACFDETCEKLGREIYRRSLRKSVYKIRVENPRMTID